MYIENIVKEEKLLLIFSTIFYCLLVDLSVKTGTRFSLRDKRLFEISEVEMTKVDCIYLFMFFFFLFFPGIIEVLKKKATLHTKLRQFHGQKSHAGYEGDIEFHLER